MEGKLIVLEGTDASGKSTQFSLLCEGLQKRKIAFKKVNFPQYDKSSSALIRMYLNGEFGEKPEDVNPYAASSFYAVDRLASYLKDWKDYVEKGGLVIADRYTTSNAIHQAAKLNGKAREDYLRWLFDFEYRLLGLKAPDMVIFLDMPTEYALKLLKDRDGKKADIHELNSDYLKLCYQNALELGEKFGWSRVKCIANGKIRKVEEIQQEIETLVLNKIGQ